ncbi:MAG: hypothetical protein AVDCRST_MAG12-140, partial [uncultured Rubrobacteraceae bacterium]
CCRRSRWSARSPYSPPTRRTSSGGWTWTTSPTSSPTWSAPRSWRWSPWWRSSSVSSCSKASGRSSASGRWSRSCAETPRAGRTAAGSTD